MLGILTRGGEKEWLQYWLWWNSEYWTEAVENLVLGKKFPITYTVRDNLNPSALFNLGVLDVDWSVPRVILGKLLRYISRYKSNQSVGFLFSRLTNMMP